MADESVSIDFLTVALFDAALAAAAEAVPPGRPAGRLRPRAAGSGPGRGAGPVGPLAGSHRGYDPERRWHPGPDRRGHPRTPRPSTGGGPAMASAASRGLWPPWLRSPAPLERMSTALQADMDRAASKAPAAL